MTEPQELQKKLHSWLESEGYPLEMLVARSFHRAGFVVRQATYYADPETGVPREIDVIASAEIDHPDGIASLTYVVECKSSRDKPWVLFTSTDVRTPQVLGFYQRLGSDLGRRFLRSVRRKPAISALSALALGDHPGYAVVQALRSPNAPDSAYAAVSQAVKAGKARARSEEELQEKSGEPMLTIVEPLVVIDGPLFECSLSHSHEIALSELGVGVLAWRHPVSGLDSVVVQIVALWSLDQYLERAKHALDTLRKECSSEMAKVFSEWRSKPNG